MASRAASLLLTVPVLISMVACESEQDKQVRQQKEGQLQIVLGSISQDANVFRLQEIVDMEVAKEDKEFRSPGGIRVDVKYAKTVKKAAAERMKVVVDKLQQDPLSKAYYEKSQQLLKLMKESSVPHLDFNQSASRSYELYRKYGTMNFDGLFWHLSREELRKEFKKYRDYNEYRGFYGDAQRKIVQSILNDGSKDYIPPSWFKEYVSYYYGWILSDYYGCLTKELDDNQRRAALDPIRRKMIVAPNGVAIASETAIEYIDDVLASKDLKQFTKTDFTGRPIFSDEEIVQRLKTYQSNYKKINDFLEKEMLPALNDAFAQLQKGQ